MSEFGGLSWRHVDYLLKQWGRYLWLFGISVGCYPRESAIVGMWDQAPPFSWFRVRQLTARGRDSQQYGGHRILAERGMVMPSHLYAVHIAVCSLGEDQHIAILVKYGSGLSAEGREFSDDEKAKALGITVDAMEQRLKRARRKLAKTLVHATGKSVDSA